MTEQQQATDSQAARRGATRRAAAGYALLAVALIAALSGAVVWALARDTPRGVEILVPTPAPLVVHMTGAVNRPGVYSLPPGSRVNDALVAAGGATTDANLSGFNLAARVTDGVRLDVPVASSPTGTTIPGATQVPSTGGLIDLNTATLEQLMTLPGIGEARAQSIIELRSTNGPIQTVDDLLQIDGIGPATVENMRPLVVQQ